MKKTLGVLVAALGLAASAPAFASLELTANGGLEGYTGEMGNNLSLGPAWGVTADIQGHVPVGLELNYLGATNQLSGATVLQNGGSAMAHISLARSNNVPIEPFVAGGIGAVEYQLVNPVTGYNNGTVGEVPLGAGVNFHIGPHGEYVSKFDLGVRGDYDILFGNSFAPSGDAAGGAYRGLVTLGGNF